MDAFLSNITTCLSCSSDDHLKKRQARYEDQYGRTQRVSQEQQERGGPLAPPSTWGGGSSRVPVGVDYEDQRKLQDEKTLRLKKQLGEAIMVQERLRDTIESAGNDERERGRIRMKLIRQDDLVAELNQKYDTHIALCQQAMAAAREQSEEQEAQGARLGAQGFRGVARFTLDRAPSGESSPNAKRGVRRILNETQQPDGIAVWFTPSIERLHKDGSASSPITSASHWSQSPMNASSASQHRTPRAQVGGRNTHDTSFDGGSKHAYFDGGSKQASFDGQAKNSSFERSRSSAEAISPQHRKGTARGAEAETFGRLPSKPVSPCHRRGAHGAEAEMFARLPPKAR